MIPDKPINLIIPTAGLGSRLGNITNKINKALLPYNSKPILSHIIDHFPKDTRLIIPVGYKAQQIKDYCDLVYPERKITYVNVDDYTSEKSGPAHSLRLCKDFVSGPFWYITCDTYFNELLYENNTDLNEDTFFVKKVFKKDTSLYTMFDIDINSKIKDIKFKKETSINWYAFTGVMYIHNFEEWWKNLFSLDSNEFIFNIEKNKATKLLNSWVDFGCLAKYEKFLNTRDHYDFSKPNELTFISNNKVCKWWLDDSISNAKIDRIQSKKEIFPYNIKKQGNFLAYDFYAGSTVYSKIDTNLFEELLNWLKKEVWIISTHNISKECLQFYKDKTNQRINSFLTENKNIQNKNIIINGKEISDCLEILKIIDYDFLVNTNVPSYIHGDLQFDNIIVDNKNEFKLIDWRQDFSGRIDVGDLYYDFGKLLAGIYVDFSKVKNNEYKFTELGKKINLHVPHTKNYFNLIEILKNLVNTSGYDWKKVEMLVPVIYLNMAALHKSPFNKFLWYLGLEILLDIKEERNIWHL